MWQVYIILFVLAAVYLSRRWRKRPTGPKMPGPVGRFFVGNEASHFNLDEWAFKFGDIFEIYSYGKRLIVLNSAELIRKANSDTYRIIFGARPNTFYGEYFAHNNQTIAFSACETNLVMRKVYNKALHVYGDGIERFEQMISKCIGKMLSKMEQKRADDFDLYIHVKEALADTICILLSGDMFEDETAGYALFWDFQRANNDILQPDINPALEMFPFLRFLPGKYKRLYNVLKRRVKAVEEQFADRHLETYVDGEIRGLVDALKKSQDDDRNNGRDVVFTDDRIRANIPETVVSGLNTSSGTVGSLYLDLIHHPKCQDKVFREISEVIGLDRAPCLQDKKHMPYTEAFTLESQRYSSPVPVGLGREATQHVMFQGYHIQKGDYLFFNHWHLNHDPAVWGDPWTFRPERFLDSEGELLPMTHTLMKSFFPFGTGTRLCVAENFARSRLFLFLTSVVQKFKLLPPQELDLISCDPRTYEMGFLLHPTNVNCRVELRQK